MKNLYKISDHTKRIISILMIFIQIRLVGLTSNTFNAKAVKDYHEIVAIFSEFLRNEGIEDPQQIYEYYNYAMWNGYFSRDHELQYSSNRDIYADNAGMSIMSGNAVCLNYADMLSLIFEKMGFNSYVTVCYVEPGNIETEIIRTDKLFARKIDQNYEPESNIFLETLTKLTGNHAVTCVEINKEIYIFDPTNLLYLNKTGINDISIINGTGKFDLKYFTSLLFENINIFKLVTYTNDSGYNEEVLEKQEININLEELEKFHNNQKENIENIANNNDKNITMLNLFIYSFIISLTRIQIRRLLNNSSNSFEKQDIEHLFPKLKEYFNEKNINEAFEILKNYELLENELGINNSIIKDILKKSILILELIIKDKKYHHTMLSLCLNNLGYTTTIEYAKKQSNNFIKKDIPLIIYFDKYNNNMYIYDYETEELLYRNKNKELCSLDDKYKYTLNNDKYSNKKYKHMNKKHIQNKMQQETTMLTKEDIKTLRRTKTLRH